MSERTFIEKVVAGEVSSSAIDDYVGAWHDLPGDDRSLQDFLGMTDDEYSLWAVCPGHLALIIEARRQRRALVDAVRDHLEAPISVTVPEAASARNRSRRWLSSATRRRDEVVDARDDALSNGLPI